MKTRRRISLLAVISLTSIVCFAQKVKIGHDKATDFSKFKTYAWAEPAMPPSKPVLFEAAVARVEAELGSKGLTRVLKDGDLTLVPAGGLDFGFAGQAGTPYNPSYGGPPPTMNSTMWTGATGPSSAAVYVTQGTLVLTFVDRASNQVVWSGSVKQKLDIEQKNKSLELVDKAVIKLLKEFPKTK
ncbi:MAG TPA: DUF4136 domain-containing protein [Candidatus Sulfotelmatobacter sp.]|nr:DUF4136 domain-containing protein [Candidatus Sulfotelmatobacter sp.]